MLWVRIGHVEEVVSVDEYATLLHDSVRSLSSRSLDVPDELVFIAILESLLYFGPLIRCQIILETFVKPSGNDVVAATDKAVAVEVVRNVGQDLFPPNLLQFRHCHLFWDAINGLRSLVSRHLFQLIHSAVVHWGCREGCRSNILTMPPLWNPDLLGQDVLGISVEQFTTFVRFFVVAKLINLWRMMRCRIEN